MLKLKLQSICFKTTIPWRVYLALILLSYTTIIQASEQKIFRILATPTMPFKISDKPKHLNPGISIEILKHVMTAMNVKYEVTFYPAVAKVLRKAQFGEGEMIIGFSITPERQKFLAYPSESYRLITWNFFIRKEDEGKIKFNTFEDLISYQIGVVKGTSYTKAFWQADSILNFQQVSKNELQIPKLLRHRIDIVPLNTRATLYEQQQAGNLDKIAYLPKALKEKAYFDPIISNSSYFNPGPESSKNRAELIKDFLVQYDQAIKDLKNNGTISNIYQKYGYTYP